MLPLPLAPLAQFAQFVAWRLEPKAGTDKLAKIPYSPIHGRMASSTNPADWGTYEQAVAMPGMSGIGFVFTAVDPFWFLDIDGALVDGKWSMLAQELLARLPGCMVEVSQSGTGLHVIGSASAPPIHRNKNIPLKIELYSKERFVALTGLQASGSVTTQADGALAAIIAQFFDPAATVGAMASEWTTGPAEGWSGPTDDFELLERIFNSAGRSAGAAFGGGITFVDLWEANTDAIGAVWPDTVQGRGFDHTNADQSMANTLAFWTGRDCARIERLMRMSALARDKWDSHGTYLQNTILKAIGLVQNVYVQTAARQPPAPTPAPPPQELEAAGFKPRLNAAPIMLSGAQLDHFKGCVYITGLNKVLTPNGDLLDQARFNVLYGGHEFVVSLDGKKTTSSAWQALTENHAFETPLAHRMCFRPECGAGGVVKDGGKLLANSYYPAEPDDAEGDPTPFLTHLQKMLPHGDDFNLLISWMACAVQNPGEKLQYWPVVQGSEGNFKTFLLLIMSHAVGSHYAHMPNMDKMVKGNSNFNGWIERKLFLGLEEVYAANRREFFESFKTTVTNLELPIEGKGLEEVTGDNRANGMITTNYQDGVPVIGKSRRFAAFFCAQQTPDDMVRDGMDAGYILHLKNWLLGRKEYAAQGNKYGIRVMSGYLRHMAIEERFNPLNMSRAPDTTSTAQAKIAGRGKAEQEVAEAIDEDRVGFAGGWVSSLKLDDLFERSRIPIPRNKRRELMQTLGYDWHPALSATAGRVNNVVAPDNGKPRLFCKVGSISWNSLTTNAEVGRAYQEAQLKASGDRSAAGKAFS